MTVPFRTWSAFAIDFCSAFQFHMKFLATILLQTKHIQTRPSAGVQPENGSQISPHGNLFRRFFRGLLRLFPPSAPRKSDSEVVLGLRSSDDALEPDEHSRPMCVRERASVCVCVKCWLSYQSPRHVNKPRHLPPTSPISPFPLERG